MQDVQMNKEELLAILKENREQHKDTYKEAVVKYHDALDKALDEHKEALRWHVENAEDGPYRLKVNLPIPEDYTEDYDKAIKMLEVEQREVITLEVFQFLQFVRDDWNWAERFHENTVSYTGR